MPKNPVTLSLQLFKRDKSRACDEDHQACSSTAIKSLWYLDAIVIPMRIVRSSILFWARKLSLYARFDITLFRKRWLACICLQQRAKRKIAFESSNLSGLHIWSVASSPVVGLNKRTDQLRIGARCSCTYDCTEVLERQAIFSIIWSDSRLRYLHFSMRST